QTAHLGQPRVVGLRRGGLAIQFRLEPRPECRVVASRSLEIRVQTMNGEGTGLLLLDQARVLEQTEMPGHARLPDAEHGCEPGHVHRLETESTNQTQPGLVAEEAQEGWGV